MFGYVTICEPELKVKDFKKYKAYYCGLCRMLKEDYGFSGQMTLTYDMTFAIIFLSSLYESTAAMEMHRCKVHPLKKQMMLRNEITSYAAAMNVLLAYHHMDDDWRDDRKVTSYMSKSILQRKAKKIIRQYLTFCRCSLITKSMMEISLLMLIIKTVKIAPPLLLIHSHILQRDLQPKRLIIPIALYFLAFHTMKDGMQR